MTGLYVTGASLASVVNSLSAWGWLVILLDVLILLEWSRLSPSLKLRYFLWSTGRQQGSATSVCHEKAAVTVPMKSLSAAPLFSGLSPCVPGPPRWPSVKASASGAEDPGFESRLRRDFSGSSHTGDLKIGTPAATLPGAWHSRVSAGTGKPGVSIL